MKSSKRTYLDICVAVFVALLASLPLIFKGIDGTIYQDLQFHLSRIESLSEGLKAGKFPVMMQSVWMNGKGYPVSIFYGDFLLYFPAVLRIFGVPIYITYKLFVLFVNLLTAVSALICFKKIFKSDRAAYVGTFLYVTSAYRLMDIYVRAAVGEYIAFIFFPIIALAMFNILGETTAENSETQTKNYCRASKMYYRNSLLLAFGMTGLIQSHLLSTVMTAFLLVIVCVLYARRTFRIKTILCLLKAVGESIILNLYFFVPFIDYYMNVNVYAGKGGDHTQAMQIRSAGAYLKQFFDFFGHIFGMNIEDIELRMQLTVGLPLMVALVVCFVMFILRYREYKVFVLGAMSVLTLWMSTNLFPWNTLEGYTHLFKILSKVQFPWRYLVAAILFLTILLGMVLAKLEGEESQKLRNYGNVTAVVLVLVGIVMTCVFTARYKEGYYPVEFREYSEVDSGYMGACEYLREGTELDVVAYVPENEHLDYYEVLSQKDNKIVVSVENSGEASTVEIPKLNYKGYVARDDNKNKLEITDGFRNLINVSVPAGYSGTITVSFKQPVSWIVSEIISLLGFIAILYYSVTKKAGETED